MILIPIFFLVPQFCEIGLTFDDGPIPQSFALVDELASRKIPAMFFPTGANTMWQNKFFEYAANRGFSFGNHTFDHVEFPKTTEQRIKDTITRQHDLVLALGAKELKWFRYPSGKVDKRSDSTLRVLGYSGHALWDVASGDIHGASVKTAFYRTKRFCTKSRNVVVLFHDSSPAVVRRTKQFISLVDLHNQKGEFSFPAYRFLYFVQPEKIFPERKWHELHH